MAGVINPQGNPTPAPGRVALTETGGCRAVRTVGTTPTSSNFTVSSPALER